MRVYNAQRRVLVTGGAGFLGSTCASACSRAGHDVLCVDNFFTGTQATTSRTCSATPASS